MEPFVYEQPKQFVHASEQHGLWRIWQDTDSSWVLVKFDAHAMQRTIVAKTDSAEDAASMFRHYGSL